MNQQEEQMLADAWLQAMVQFIPKISERNHARMEQSEQEESLHQIL